MKRILCAIGLGLLLTLVLAVPSHAGGWAVITLDELPGQVVAGQTLEIGFMVRQHGVTPMEGLTPIIHARLLETGQTLTLDAKESGETGHYVATLTLPEAGEWQWSIEAFTGNQPMPALVVVATSPVISETAETSASARVPWPQWLAGFLGVAGILVGLVIAFQRKARLAILLVLAGVLVSAGSIVSAADQPGAASEASPKQDGIPAAPNVSQVELGHQLFIAKGCMICHSHAETNKVREFGVDLGPNLTAFTASPDYLRLWLKDPASVKSTAQMPTLGLSDEEIEALIAFINDKSN